VSGVTPVVFEEFRDLRGVVARAPPEDRGIPRDRVRLLVSDRTQDHHRVFCDLPRLLRPGDLLVVNISATVPGRFPAQGSPGSFLLHRSTAFAPDLWLAEPRWSASRPGPVPLAAGEALSVVGVPARYLGAHPTIPRLGWVRFDEPPDGRLAAQGEPIRYGYVDRSWPLDRYQTIFSRIPGSSEMPSAARPFTPAMREELRRRGVRIAEIVLHTAVSSLELADGSDGSVPLVPEPFEVPSATVAAIEETRARGGRVIAVGTTVVRALESAGAAGNLRATAGFTRLYVQPGRPVRFLDGLLTGFHEASSTHLALLGAVIPKDRLLRAYRTAVRAGYLWHEFGDSHLLWSPRDSPAMNYGS
jgi:S-adenosylmethionine:tRNA ribosyltransferase-isomerase